jgi:hypothetical protein
LFELVLITAPGHNDFQHQPARVSASKALVNDELQNSVLLSAIQRQDRS